MDKHQILSDSQYGFRKGFSADLAIATLQENVTKAKDDKEHVFGIFLDWLKAFDTAIHEILLSKLELYGIKGISLRLIKSYLNRNLQYVEYNHIKLEAENVNCGVPR